MGFQGRLTNAGLGKESTYGTAVAATTTIPVASFTVWERTTIEDAADLHHGGGGVTQRRAELGRDVGGTLETLMSYETLGLLLEAAIGENTTTGAGPYQHRFTHVDPALLPALTIRGRLGNTTHVSVLAGCKVNSLKLKWKAREFAKVEADIIGRTLDSFGSGSPGTPTIGALVLPHQVGAFAWNSVSYTDMVELELEVANNLTRNPVLGALATDEPMPNDRRQVRAKCTARLSASEYEALVTACRAGTTSNFTFTFTGSGGRSIAFTVHNAQVVETPEGQLTQHGPVLVSWVFAATHDGTGVDGLLVDYTNNNASYDA